MPKHDMPTDTAPVDEELTEEQAEHVEGIARILCEHLYAGPDADCDNDPGVWEETSEENKRIFRSCALDVDRFNRGVVG